MIFVQRSNQKKHIIEEEKKGYSLNLTFVQNIMFFKMIMPTVKIKIKYYLIFVLVWLNVVFHPSIVSY